MGLCLAAMPFVFTENLESGFDRTAYETLDDDCRAATTDDFLALPGFKFRDMIDVTYMVHSMDGKLIERFPGGKDLTPDRPVKVVKHNLGINLSGIYEIGRVARTTIDPWLMLCCRSIAPYTYDDGKLVDDGFETYLSLNGRRVLHRNFTMALVRSPARLHHTVENTPLTARFLTINKPWDGEEAENNRWLAGLIRDHAVGGGTPAYTYAVWPCLQPAGACGHLGETSGGD